MPPCSHRGTLNPILGLLCPHMQAAFAGVWGQVLCPLPLSVTLCCRGSRLRGNPVFVNLCDVLRRKVLFGLMVFWNAFSLSFLCSVTLFCDAGGRLLTCVWCHLNWKHRTPALTPYSVILISDLLKPGLKQFPSLVSLKPPSLSRDVFVGFNRGSDLLCLFCFVFLIA